jgi:hypothetical protein
LDAADEAEELFEWDAVCLSGTGDACAELERGFKRAVFGPNAEPLAILAESDAARVCKGAPASLLTYVFVESVSPAEPSPEEASPRLCG